MSFPSSSSSHHAATATNLQCILGDESRLHYAVIHKNLQDAAVAATMPPSLSRSKSTGSFSSSVPPRRLSSGSACEICRRRKTKCDGGNPCAFCSANRIECVHRATRRKKSSLAISQTNTDLYKPASSSRPAVAAAAAAAFQMREVTPSPTASSPSSWAATITTNATPPPPPLAHPSPHTSPASGTTTTTTTTGAVKGYNMEGYKSHLSKQTSCPSLIASAHWSPNPADPCTVGDGGGGPPAAAAAALTPNHDGPRGTPRQDYSRYAPSKEEMPSMMDQLSCRTFSAVVDHRTDYPIYPLSGSTPAAAATATSAPSGAAIPHTSSHHHHRAIIPPGNDSSNMILDHGDH